MKGIPMNTINKITLVAAKIMEVLHWIGAVSMSVLLICSLTAKGWLGNLFQNNKESFGTALASYGFEISIVRPNGTINITAITLFSIGAVILLSLFAMIFRNAYLILKTAKGKTWFAKSDTPFQKDIVRMLREIGIFLISAPLTGYVMSIIARAVIGIEAAEISVNFEGVMIGLLVLCLFQFFAYGAELQKDADGLL